MAEKIDPKDPRAKLARSMKRIFDGTAKKDDGAVLLSYLTGIVSAPVWLSASGQFTAPEAAAFADGRRNLAFDLIGSGHFDVRNIRED
jgi:hypothetical protein